MYAIVNKVWHVENIPYRVCEMKHIGPLQVEENCFSKGNILKLGAFGNMLELKSQGLILQWNSHGIFWYH